MPESDQNWAAVLDRLLQGDRLALVEVTRLVNGFLVRWNAYDFRDEWSDLVQEVAAAAAIALRDGKLRDPGAALGYLYSTARFKYLDRLRIHLRLQEGAKLAWDEAIAWSEPPLTEEAREDLRRAMARLPEQTRRAVLAVYLDGRTYDEAARETGIPLGTLKRCLRLGLAELRSQLSEVLNKR